MKKRLTRSKNGAILGGVCLGLGNYLNIDPVFVRIFFVLLGITTGIGVLAYLIMWIVVPRDDQVPADDNSVLQPSDFGDRAKLMGDEIRDATSKTNPKLPFYIGIGLLVIGGFALLRALPFTWVKYIDTFMWPFLLVVAGIVLLTRGSSKGA